MALPTISSFLMGAKNRPHTPTTKVKFSVSIDSEVFAKIQRHCLNYPMHTRSSLMNDLLSYALDNMDS